MPASSGTADGLVVRPCSAAAKQVRAVLRGRQALLVGIHSNVTRRKDDKPHTLFLVTWISFG